MENKELIEWWESRLGHKLEDPESFLMGAKDCYRGADHKSNLCSNYDYGFSSEYTRQQNINRREL